MMSETEEWYTVKRPGFFGKDRDSIQKQYDNLYGAGNWRIQWMWRNGTIPFELAIQIYEDAYYNFLKDNPKTLVSLLGEAKDVFDNAESNIESKLDYSIQENESNHYQDIAIRRVVLRLGGQFRGKELVQIRSHKSYWGDKLSPGKVPFHLPSMIYKPAIVSWWDPNTIEDFWQSNKYLEVRKIA